MDPLFNTILNINNDIEKALIYTSNSLLTERADAILKMEKIQYEPWYTNALMDWRVHWILADQSLFGVKRFVEPYPEYPLNLLFIKLKYDKFFSVDFDIHNTYGILFSTPREK